MRHTGDAQISEADARAADAIAVDAPADDAEIQDGAADASIDAGQIPVSIARGSFAPLSDVAQSRMHAVAGRIAPSGTTGTASGAAHRLRGLGALR
jgi:hypothetical protein